VASRDSGRGGNAGDIFTAKKIIKNNMTVFTSQDYVFIYSVILKFYKVTKMHLP